MKHTPTPWKCEGNRAEGYLLMGPDGSLGEVYICGEPKNCNAKENAAFVVRAVNVYEELLVAGKLGLEIAESWIHDQLDGTSQLESALDALEPVRKAIAKAEAE